MDDVRRFVAAMCDMQHKGGRCVCRGAEVLLVYDACKWTDDMSQQLKQHFPYCVADVSASSSSLSGFVVHISHRQHSTTNSVVVLMFVMVFSSFLFAYHIVHRFTETL